MTVLSIVIPCLNEEDTLRDVIRAAKVGIEGSGVEGEILVADNGSTDGSVQIAEDEGVRVVPVEEKGYGAALQGGIRAASGDFIMMGDADCSYDFAETPKFFARYEEGYEFVMGCRLPGGGGTVMPGAMPPSHRLLGNPMFTRMARWLFRAPIHDVYCGLRGFTRAHYERLNMQCTGMEFAVEMVIKSAMLRAKITEVPITLHPDKRVAHAPHLKTFRDGWRTLRFLLMSSPNWIAVYPSILMVLAGVVLYLLGHVKFQLGPMSLDVHTMIIGSLGVICGYQGLLFALTIRTFAETNHLLPPSGFLQRFFKYAKLEVGIPFAAVISLAGIALILAVVLAWRADGFGPLAYAETMRMVVPGATLLVLAFQTFTFSFMVSVIGIHRR